MDTFSYRKLVLGILVSGAFAVSSHAAMMTLELDANINGAPSSVGSLTATFTDAPPGQNGVFLELDTSNLAANEKVQSWYFNLDPALNPGSLIFSQTNKIGSFSNPTISKSGNEIPPGGGPSFDFKFTFSTAGPPNSFSGGESVRYFISGISGLNVDSFNVHSFFNGVGYSSAAHVQENPSGRGGATLVSVPEPGHAIFGALLLGGLVWIERGRIRAWMRTR